MLREEKKIRKTEQKTNKLPPAQLYNLTEQNINTNSSLNNVYSIQTFSYRKLTNMIKQIIFPVKKQILAVAID